MKRTNAPPIPEGLRIELNGEQEWTAVMQVFEDAGWKWINGDKPTDVIEAYCNDEMYLPTVITENNKELSRADKYVINKTTAAQFLQQYQGTIEYEVGDWVVVVKPCSTSNNKRGIVGKINVLDKVTLSSYGTCNGARINGWFENILDIRPATPEEIASVTKVEPVAVKKPELYIWDGDVLPDEYWVKNPNKESCEIAQYLKMLSGGKHWNGDGEWYKITPEDVIAREKKQEDDLPIVPYELWKQILTTPDNQVEQPAGRKWKVGDRYCIKGTGDSDGWYIREHSNNLYKVETAKGLTDWNYTAREIDEYVNSEHWVPDHRAWSKSSKEKDDNTIISKQTKTKQNENIKEGISISTEQCIVISSNYINSKTSNATYVPGDEERITKGQRRQGSTVRG